MSLPLSIMVGCIETDMPRKTESCPEEKFLEQVYSRLYGNSRSARPFEIIDLTTKTYEVINDSAIEVLPTRSENSGYPTFRVKTAVLDFKGTKGFAVFSDDENIDRVFFITEKGDLSNVEMIEPLSELLESIPQDVVDMLDETENGIGTRTTLANELIDNICRFKWGQCGPYNLYASVCHCTTCTDRFNKQTPIGCVTTAVAQAIATMGVFPGTYYGNKNMDFSNMEVDYRNVSWDKRWKIGQFFHEIAHGCQVKYMCSEKGGSKTTFNVANQYLSEIGYSSVYVKGGIDASRVLSGLRQGIPHLIGGNRDGGAGHAWIITGISIHNGKVDYYCNWGDNGDYNGWSYGNPYTKSSSYVYKNNNDHIYINSKNLRK